MVTKYLQVQGPHGTHRLAYYEWGKPEADHVVVWGARGQDCFIALFRKGGTGTLPLFFNETGSRRKGDSPFCQIVVVFEFQALYLWVNNLRDRRRL